MFLLYMKIVAVLQKIYRSNRKLSQLFNEIEVMARKNLSKFLP